MKASSNNPKAHTTKYRLTLSAAQIMHMIDLARADIIAPKDEASNSNSMSIIGYLSPFKAKIDNLSISEAYTLAPPKQTLLEGLGEIDPLSPSSASKEEYWESCYEMYIAQPDSMTISEVRGAREHMYLNDLMTPEEAAIFEDENDAEQENI